MRPRVNTRKHYIQWTITPVAVGTTVTENIVNAVDVLVSKGDVVTGAIVSAVYIEIWIIGQSDSASGNVLVSLYKQPGDGTILTQADHVDLDAYSNKKNVFYHTQGITNDGVANATPFIRQWFKLPKGKQRMGLGDRIRLAISTQAEAVNYCGFALYKEQF